MDTKLGFPQLRTLTASLLALSLPALLPARPLCAMERPALMADGGGYVASASRHTAHFDGSAFEIVGQDGERSQPSPAVRFHLLEVRQGPTLLVSGREGDPPAAVSGGRISYARRAGLVERYDVLETGVEQSFVLDRRLSGGGDLVITGSLDSDQTLGRPFADGAGGLVVPLGEGHWRLRYGAVTAIDAAGAKRAGVVAIADGRITLTVDGAWLANASYPVIVDPLVKVEADKWNQGRPAAAFDFGGSPSFPSATDPRYLVAYESDRDGGPRQIWEKLISWNGTNVGSLTGTNISADPSVAHAKPTVAFKFGRLDFPKRNYLVAWERSDGALGYRILDLWGNPLMAPRKISSSGISGSTLHDVTAAAAPQGGWRASLCGTTLGCAPYLLAYRAAGLATAGMISTVRLAVIDDGNGTLWKDVPIDSLGLVDDPSYAPHIAYGHSLKADYYLLAYRLANGAIVVRKVSTFGTPGPALTIASSSSGPPVVAYNYANNRWGVFWRTTVSNRLGTWVMIKGQMLDGNVFWDPLVPVGPLVTAVSIPLPEFFTTRDLLPEYSAAGSQSAVDSFPFLGLFELAYVDTTRASEVYSVKVYTNGALGPATRLTSDTQADRYVKLAATRIDPLTSGYANPRACTGTASSRCALWLFEHTYSNSDHDIYGLWTASEY
jgi:hypothetical protein